MELHCRCEGAAPEAAPTGTTEPGTRAGRRPTLDFSSFVTPGPRA